MLVSGYSLRKDTGSVDIWSDISHICNCTWKLIYDRVGWLLTSHVSCCGAVFIMVSLDNVFECVVLFWHLSCSSALYRKVTQMEDLDDFFFVAQ